MAIDLPIPFTFRALFKVCLVVAAEGAVLALIRDASTNLQVVTVIAAIVGFAALECEDRLRALHKYLFQGTIGIAAVIWLYFVFFAVGHAISRDRKEYQLGEIYASGEPLVTRASALAYKALPDDQSQRDYKNDLDQLDIDAKQWEIKTASWLLDNVGAVSRARFLDLSDIHTYCWSVTCEFQHSTVVNRLVNEMKNLSAIRESPTYLN